MIFKLQELMNKVEINQLQLSDATGLATTTIGRIARNQASRIDVETVEKLANYFGLETISELMELKEVKE